MSFYQVTLNGRYADQDIVNILWYRDATLFAAGLEFFGLLDALAATVEDTVWASRSPAFIGGRGMQDVMLEGYTLETISIMAYTDGAALLSDTPFVRPVGEAGLVAGNSNGPATVINLRANLEPSFGPGIGLPKKGYLALGPLSDGSVGQTGHIGATDINDWNAFGEVLASNLVTVLPASVFFPIRVKIVRAPLVGTILSIGYKDVSDFIAQPIAKFRRSRLPEA
jgi:hypothetical protein